MKAKLLFRQKYIHADGAIVELKAWPVLISERAPEGFKYSLVYIDSQGNRILGYDNAEGKGHHRHEGKKETPFPFKSIEKLAAIFLKEVDTIRGRHHED